MSQEALLEQGANSSELKLFRVIHGVSPLKDSNRSLTLALLSLNAFKDPSKPKMSLLAPVDNRGRVILEGMRLIPTELVLSGGISKSFKVTLPGRGRIDYELAEITEERVGDKQKVSINLLERPLIFPKAHEVINKVGVYSDEFWEDEDIERFMKKCYRGHLRWWLNPLVNTFGVICRKITCSQRSLNRVV